MRSAIASRSRTCSYCATTARGARRHRHSNGRNRRDLWRRMRHAMPSRPTLLRSLRLVRRILQSARRCDGFLSVSCSYVSISKRLSCFCQNNIIRSLASRKIEKVGGALRTPLECNSFQIMPVTARAVMMTVRPDVHGACLRTLPKRSPSRKSSWHEKCFHARSNFSHATSRPPHPFQVRTLGWFGFSIGI